MKSHPIIMQPHLAQAAFEGRKTVTRRIGDRYAKWKVGDQLWVKETWAVPHGLDGCKPKEITPAARIYFAANANLGGNHNLGGLLVRTSIFMPRWAARTVCTITSIRQEPLHDITEADAIAEGIVRLKDGWQPFPGGPWFASPIAAFRALWESINGPGSWDSNPLVWRIEFENLK